MVPLKGHRILIDALARLPPEPSWVCWLVGGPQTDEEAEYERGLREHVDRLNLEGRVQFLGATDDVMAILRETQIYCQPNERPEAFGLSFVEALHAGVPVVTTAIGGAREIVTDACGRLVPRGDVEALAATLRSLIEDPAARRTLGRNGPARAWMLCNPEARLDQLRVVLGRVALEAAA
jgi:glycosyltransferase involved in cell wall biosynthesis